MEINELQPADNHVIVVPGGVEVQTLAELIEFDLEALLEQVEEAEQVLEEAWGGVIIGGDLTIDGDTTSNNLPQGLEGFGAGYPISADGYSPNYFIVVLGNLTVNGSLEVEQLRDLYVKGNINVKSYLSTSGNILCSGVLTAQEIICTNATDEGGIFRPSKAIAPGWISTGNEQYFMYEELEFENVRIAADEFTPGRELACAAAAVALGKPTVESNDLWAAMKECIKDGKASAFLEAYASLTPAAK